ncbi:hypothetical protein QBC46DRAFT_289261 [Diplogelasinospora grovesii]|uniref:Uncharacterized protein n=1 Tax=Diplogelasinospora grovesii TaxID=303347 RepID=A0AAN6N696_9PEZI|nr:hypothetical protein QBC46DRAFT_289261 [Diplogelasinospora grovesii]
MGKKKRGHPDVEELLSRPWCYYCERDFEDLKLLISHQKAKHFKCERCGKRLNTAGGLSVHMNQVHKESLSNVENALPNRQGLDIEIFGMEGVPEDIVQQHNQRIIQNYYTAQAERHAATGNPPSGQGHGPAKKIKIETPEEIKKRLAEHKARVAAQKAAAANGTAPPVDGQSPGQGTSPFPPPQAGFPYPTPGVPPSFPPGQAYPPAYPSGGPSPPPGAAPFSLPARPPNNVPAVGGALPQRPPYYPYGPGGAPPPGLPGTASTVDELVAGASRPGGDDIDQLIRMAEAGIKPPKTETPQPDDAGAVAATEKKGRKDKEKNTRMVYADSEVSPEERMAMMPRYAFASA